MSAKMNDTKHLEKSMSGPVLFGPYSTGWADDEAARAEMEARRGCRITLAMIVLPWMLAAAGFWWWQS